MDDDLRAAVHQETSAGQLTKLGTQKGMRLLRHDGVRLVREGVTTVQEVLRVAI